MRRPRRRRRRIGINPWPVSEASVRSAAIGFGFLAAKFVTKPENWPAFYAYARAIRGSRYDYAIADAQWMTIQLEQVLWEAAEAAMLGEKGDIT